MLIPLPLVFPENGWLGLSSINDLATAFIKVKLPTRTSCAGAYSLFGFARWEWGNRVRQEKRKSPCSSGYSGACYRQQGSVEKYPQFAHCLPFSFGCLHAVRQIHFPGDSWDQRSAVRSEHQRHLLWLVSGVFCLVFPLARTFHRWFHVCLLYETYSKWLFHCIGF